jgi:signal transduction histidine kinase
VVDTTATILADETRLQQLLENLFRNAVEHGATSRRSLTLPTTPERRTIPSRRSLTLPTTPLNTARRALPRTTRRTARPA